MRTTETINLFISVIFLFAVSSCKTDFDDVNYYDGDADLNSVVVIGGSHLAGYMDRALYLEAQSHSIPAILATRFSFVGGKELVQPLVYPGVGIGISGNSKYVLKEVSDPCFSGTMLVAEPSSTVGDVSNYTWLGDLVPFNNLAVPNTRIYDVISQSYGNPSQFLGNPLYARFATEPGTSTILGDALLQTPTFIMIWLGMEDIYNFARTGGDEGGDSITSSGVFNTQYINLVTQLTSLGAGGVLMNIPNLSTIPFFNAIPYNGLVLTAQEASDLNILYATVDPAISFSEGNNTFVIADAGAPTGRRKIMDGEYILLSVSRDSINCQEWGRTIPIPERYVLDADEVTEINAAINYYNSVIQNTALANEMALADMNVFFNRLQAGILFNNVNYNVEYLDGGAFSTDGYHPSQRGGALIANEIITTINRFYSAKIPQVDVNAFTGIVFP